MNWLKHGCNFWHIAERKMFFRAAKRQVIPIRGSSLANDLYMLIFSFSGS